MAMKNDCFNCDKPECVGGKFGCADKHKLDNENAKRRERYQAKKGTSNDEAER
jgi:hypothetical protein